ncbi:MAG: hypothetical protein SPL28_03645 [Bacteroidales bacterium]|nr:hypothetical protein [Bacteroidales bacterium]MDY6412074.1 hypothetical protein [Bacteroidales bacterium]
MNDDIRLQELFDSFHPTLADSNLFNQRLDRKLKMIDEIKQAQTNQIRHYRMAVVAAFVAGIIFGSVIFAIILTTPSDVPLFSFGINFYPLMLIEQNSRLISMLLTSLIIAFCIVAMMNINEMVNRIRPQRKP